MTLDKICINEAVKELFFAAGIESYGLNRCIKDNALLSLAEEFGYVPQYFKAYFKGLEYVSWKYYKGGLK